MNRRSVGAAYEQGAARYLEAMGYEILHRNYRCRMGEIDLVIKDGKTIVFVEVKYRAKGEKGNALEAVDIRKQKTISVVAAYYLMRECQDMDIPCRFDVVGIDGDEIHHVKNAFDAIEYY